MKQLLLLVLLLVSTVGMSQDTLSIHQVSPVLFVHLDSTQAIVTPFDEVYIYTNDGFYLTVDPFSVAVASGAMLYFIDEYYYVVPTCASCKVTITVDGEPTTFNVRPNTF